MILEMSIKRSRTIEDYTGIWIQIPSTIIVNEKISEQRIKCTQTYSELRRIETVNFTIDENIITNDRDSDVNGQFNNNGEIEWTRKSEAYYPIWRRPCIEDYQGKWVEVSSDGQETIELSNEKISESEMKCIYEKTNDKIKLLLKISGDSIMHKDNPGIIGKLNYLGNVSWEMDSKNLMTWKRQSKSCKSIL